MKSGIYAVANIGPFRLYMGETHQLGDRWQQALTQLSQGAYTNKALQAEWVKQQGDRRFTFHTAADLLQEKDLLGRKQLLRDLEDSAGALSD